MKLKSLLLTLFVQLFALSTWAYDAEVDGFYYNFNGSEATVTYRMQYVGSYKGDIVIPEKVTYKGKTYSVTSIGEEGFLSCREMTSVKIPNSIVSIGARAFDGCSGLSTVTIPEAVTTIGNRAFYECKNLTSVTFLSNIRSLEQSVFSSCSKLETMSGIDSLEYIGSGCFDGTALLNNQKDGLFYIGMVAYKYKGTMPANTNVVIKDGTKSIAFGAFSNCSGLSYVRIPSSVVSIGSAAFSNCSGLTSVTIPDGVQSIEQSAFARCTALQSIVIPNSVTSIGMRCFDDCTALASITLHDNITFLGGKCFNKTPWYSKVPEGMVYIGSVAYAYKGSMPEGTSLTIKDGTTCISDYAFDSRGTLVSVNIPSSVEYIGSDAFSYCNALTQISIPEGVKTIGSAAFYKCQGLKSVYIPSSVTVLGYSCFKSSYNIQHVYVAHTTPLPIVYDDFSCTSVATLHVPIGCKEIYKEAMYWQGFKEITDDIDFTNVSGVPTGKETGNSIFSLDGRHLATPHHGLNIIHKSDGRTIKVIKK